MPPSIWTMTYQSILSSHFGDCVAAARWIATGHLAITPSPPQPLQPVDCHVDPAFSNIQHTPLDTAHYSICPLPYSIDSSNDTLSATAPFVCSVAPFNKGTPVFDPACPLPELPPTLFASDSLFDTAIAIRFTAPDSTAHARFVSWPELLTAYLRTSLPANSQLPSTHHLTSLLRSSTPHFLSDSICQWALPLLLSPPHHADPDSEIARCWWVSPHIERTDPTSQANTHAVSCNSGAIRPFPSPLNCTTAYEQDDETNPILKHLQSGLP